jgi:hypothetical protein
MELTSCLVMAGSIGGRGFQCFAYDLRTPRAKNTRSLRTRKLPNLEPVVTAFSEMTCATRLLFVPTALPEGPALTRAFFMMRHLSQSML